MKRFVLFICITFASVGVYSQDIIVKKSGAEIKSKITEITLETIKYKQYDKQSGPLRNIAKSDVFMIIYEDGTREKIQAAQTKTSSSRSRYASSDKPKVKMVHEGGAAIQAGLFSGDYSEMIGVDAIGSFMLGKHVSLGLGLGILINPDYGDPLIPVFMDAKFFILKKINSPFIYSDLGGVVRTDGGEGNLIYEFGGGFKFQVGSKNSMFVSLGYHADEYSYENYTGEELTDTYGSIALKVGFNF